MNESQTPSILQFLGRWFFRAILGLFAFSLLLTFVYRWLPVPLTPLMMYRAGQALGEGRLPRLEKSWVSLDQMSPRLKFAVLAAEDMKFYEHKGFDWEAIEKARKHNLRNRTIRGASTISQQVAKNVFLLPQRSWIRKGLEAYFTFLIEHAWPKERIMEVYLNIVELGDGVYGVEAASERYFSKPAVKVNASEAALIAAVLPNPRRFKISRPSGYVRLRQTKIRNRMPTAARLAKTPVLKTGLSHRGSIAGSK